MSFGSQQNLLLVWVWLLTRADRDGLQELLPPAACPDHQGQVGLLQEFVHGALEDSETSQSPNNYQSETIRTQSHLELVGLLYDHLQFDVLAQHRSAQLRNPPLLLLLLGQDLLAGLL